MEHNFIIKSLSYSSFKHLFEKSREELKKLNAVRVIVDKKPGYPCRVSLQDAELGEEVLLVPFNHHNVGTPYLASGPIFVRKDASVANLEVNEIPEMLVHRLLSIRVYNEDGMMIDAQVCEGSILKESINSAFNNDAVSYLHVHNAKPGCFNCIVCRA